MHFKISAISFICQPQALLTRYLQIWTKNALIGPKIFHDDDDTLFFTRDRGRDMPDTLFFATRVLLADQKKAALQPDPNLSGMISTRNFYEMGRHEVILSISGCIRHEKFMPDRFQALPRPKNFIKRANYGPKRP